MIVRSLDQVIGTDRDVSGDGMGFSLHDTTVAAGAELELEYRHRPCQPPPPQRRDAIVQQSRRARCS
jgi:hypothetical protein